MQRASRHGGGAHHRERWCLRDAEGHGGHRVLNNDNRWAAGDDPDTRHYHHRSSDHAGTFTGPEHHFDNGPAHDDDDDDRCAVNHHQHPPGSPGAAVGRKRFSSPAGAADHRPARPGRASSQAPG